MGFLWNLYKKFAGMAKKPPLSGEVARRNAETERLQQICDDLSVTFGDSVPTPFVPSGHFPLIGGIGPWKGSQGVRAAGSAYQRRNTRRALDSVARATSSAGMPRRSAIFLATYGTRLGSQRRPRKGSGAM